MRVSSYPFNQQLLVKYLVTVSWAGRVPPLSAGGSTTPRGVLGAGQTASGVEQGAAIYTGVHREGGAGGPWVGWQVLAGWRVRRVQAPPRIHQVFCGVLLSVLIRVALEFSQGAWLENGELSSALTPPLTGSASFDKPLHFFRPQCWEP